LIIDETERWKKIAKDYICLLIRKEMYFSAGWILDKELRMLIKSDG